MLCPVSGVECSAFDIGRLSLGFPCMFMSCSTYATSMGVAPAATTTAPLFLCCALAIGPPSVPSASHMIPGGALNVKTRNHVSAF